MKRLKFICAVVLLVIPLLCCGCPEQLGVVIGKGNVTQSIHYSSDPLLGAALFILAFIVLVTMIGGVLGGGGRPQ